MTPLGGLRRAYETARYMRDPYGYLRARWESTGDTFELSLLGQRGWAFSHPESLKRIFADNECLDSGLGDRLRPFLGNYSLLLLNDEAHRRHRRLMKPAFLGARMQRHGELIARLVAMHVHRWPLDTPIPMQRELLALGLAVITRVIFGIEDEQAVNLFASRVTAALRAMTGPLLFFPMLRRDIGVFRAWSRFHDAKAALDVLLFDVIARRRDSPEGDDVLSMLLASRDSDGQGLGDQEVRDELLTLLISGHETTATALAWTLKLLAMHPEVHDRLVGEVRESSASAHELAQLPFLSAVCKEALRLQPVVAVATRRAIRPFHISGVDVPVGSYVRAAIYLTHRRADLYPQPHAFVPERFMERRFAPNEYLPFGGGLRRCIGSELALFQMNVTLGTLLRARRLVSQRRELLRTRRHNLTIAPRDDAHVALCP